mgnify:CR=1 FL=1
MEDTYAHAREDPLQPFCASRTSNGACQTSLHECGGGGCISFSSRSFVWGNHGHPNDSALDLCRGGWANTRCVDAFHEGPEDLRKRSLPGTLEGLSPISGSSLLAPQKVDKPPRGRPVPGYPVILVETRRGGRELDWRDPQRVTQAGCD